MTGRHVFFSFNYSEDVWRASNVRKAGQFDARASAGWTDASIWEEAKLKGPVAVRKLIDSGLSGTSVTAVLIGFRTAEREWVNYEIEKSIQRGNGLIGIHIHRMKDQFGRTSPRGPVPRLLRDGQFRIYDWDRSSLGQRVELAALQAGKPCLRHQQEACFTCRWLTWW